MCHVNAQNFSQWSIAQRIPHDLTDIDNLAAVMGPEVYEILEIQPRMPKDKKLKNIANGWLDLSDQQKKELEERFLNMVADNKKGPQLASQPAPQP